MAAAEQSVTAAVRPDTEHDDAKLQALKGKLAPRVTRAPQKIAGG